MLDRIIQLGMGAPQYPMPGPDPRANCSPQSPNSGR